MTIRTIIYAALLAAVTAILAQIAIPLPGGVPFTLQVLAVFLGILLFSKKSFWGMLTYLILGAIGLPVFANAHGGLGSIIGPTGGYLLGFLVSAYVGGLILELSNFKLWGQIAALVVAIVIIYTLGVAQLAIVLKLPLPKAIAAGALPFIPFDLLKGVLAILITTPLEKSFKNAGINLHD